MNSVSSNDLERAVRNARRGVALGSSTHDVGLAPHLQRPDPILEPKRLGATERGEIKPLESADRRAVQRGDLIGLVQGR
jgi:hypothetical protein